jgi:hypothetical protein
VEVQRTPWANIGRLVDRSQADIGMSETVMNFWARNRHFDRVGQTPTAF